MQRKKLERSFRFLKLYLVEHLSTRDIARRKKCRAQWISKVLDFGITYLVENGHVIVYDCPLPNAA